MRSETVSSLASHEHELATALRSYVPRSAEEEKLVRKIDMLLMPILWIMYILNYVDRTNILVTDSQQKGNAKIAGMTTDLDLDDDRYAWVLSVFFFGYLICEVPSNMILSRSRPSVFLPTIMLVWGVLSVLMSIAKTYGALLGLRFVLGCIEAGKRFGIFCTAAVLSGAFGGISAGAIISHLHNVRGITGWRWLFILEGVATVGVALVAFFVLLDYPSTSKRLTPEERSLAAIRIIHDGIATEGHSDKPLTHGRALVAAVADPRTYMFLILLMLDVGAGTISYFIPTISQTIYKDSVQAQYMTVPIYIVAAVCLNAVAWSSDRTGDRRWHITSALGLGFACSVVCAAVQASVVRYVMVCFVVAGIWSALPLILSWTSTTVSLPPEKRAIVLALVNAFGNFSSVYGSRIWPKHNAPTFHIGFGVTAGFLGGGMVLAATLPVLCGLFTSKGARKEMKPNKAYCEGGES
ncbi:hypothetical protein ED733_007611 [Metarhizium rileyi]|uniref:Major facilitator superfamily domain, general substrate transporter n=1 Tax=Metarhizium rileyi (strain RCEF 4871) TaxID=1649241 RepID=A0A5C6GEE4_METRR|nr:hypothetical protein ED733_007611 [Metarhizium rileyi]